MRDHDRLGAEAAHNLPSRLSSFVGREREIAEIAMLLDGHRLVTLVGAPGVGKTRLGLQIASAVLERFPDGVWLVELAPLADPALVPQAVADVLGVREQSARSLTATLSDWLRVRRLLLLLDNCEHLIGAAAELAGMLLRDCPRLHVLATSREPLAVDGEAPWRVPSLAQPAPELFGGGAASTALLEYEAIRLFVERARVVAPRFALTRGNASIVAQICTRLDGIPLAIELAAARVRALSVDQIAARLDDRFRLLTGGSRAALPRQQTLRGAVDWSYDLLSEPERALLRRLAVFAGGFTLDAAERVGDERSGMRGEMSDALLLDLLTALVDKSLIQVEESDDGEPRYRLLETFRQYGHEKLIEHSELSSARDRHRDYFLAVTEGEQPNLDGSDQLAALTRLDREHDNLRAALAWCLADETGQHVDRDQGAHALPAGAAEPGLRLAGALWRFWWWRGYLDEGRRWLSQVLAIPARRDQTAAERSARAITHEGAASLAAFQGELHLALEHAETALALSRDADDGRGVSQALHRLGFVRLHLGEHDLAHRLCEESVETARRTGDPHTLAMALLGSSHVSRFLDEHDQTVAFCEEGLTLFRALGDIIMSANLLRTLSRAVLGLGDRARAWLLAEEALSLSRDLGDRRGMGESYQMLGKGALLDGDVVRAIAMLRSAIAVFHETGARWLILWAFFRLAEARTLQGVQAACGQAAAPALSPGAREYFRDAVRLFAAVMARRQQHGVGPVPQMDREYDRVLPILRQHLGESTFAQGWAEGQAMDFEEIVAYALEITRDAAPAGPVTPSRAPALSADDELARLTPREREIATLVARGLANREIAESLTVAQRTVETHVHNILGKLELTSRGQLAFWAVEHGLMTTGHR